MIATGERKVSTQRAATASPDRGLGSLPEWNLADLYPGRDSPELKRDLAAVEADANAFRERYQGKLATLSGAALGAAIATYERLDETLGRIISYASLVHAGDMSDPEIGRFYQTMQEKVNAVGTIVLFFTLELNRIEDEALDEKLKRTELAHYAPWLRDRRAFAAASARRRSRAAAAREVGVGPRRLDPALRRDDGRSALSARRQGADQRGGAPPALRSRFRDPREGGKEPRRGARQECPPVLPHHQYARQGQGDRGPLARLPAPDLVAQPREFRRGRGRRRADLGGPVVLSRSRRIATIGSRRNGSASSGSTTGTATRRCPTRTTGSSRGARRSRPCSTPTAPSRPSSPRSARASSPIPGSMRRRGRARRRAPSRIRPCRARIPICCSTTRASSATS